MICKLIGIGAAGNKAAICAVENNIIEIENTMLINSTLKDIPQQYQSKENANCKKLLNAYGGCGKERQLSYQLCEDSIKADTLKLGEFLKVDTDEEAELCIIVASTEGGTGSGSVPLLARYIRDVYGISVHVFGIAGFEEDVRGMRNTVDFFKEMQENFTVECIKNAKYLPMCNGNKIKAEKEANRDFCKKISVLMGLQIRDSEHNIDPTDLLKLSTEEGYMIIETYIFDGRIKNAEQFKSAVIDMVDASKALDIDDPSQTKLGVIINIREENTDYIDYYSTLIERFGTPYEKFEHIQHETTMPEFISFIAAGMKMPVEEVESTYEHYKESVERVNKSSDSFFSTIQEKEIDPTDNKFDLKAKKKATVSKDDFFKKGFSNTKTKVRMTQVDNTEEY